MNLKLLLALFVACLLVACAHSRSAARPASNGRGNDLKALLANAERDLAPRTLPNGKLYCAEDSTTEDQQDRCTGDLEDLVLDSETDKAVALVNLRRGLDAIWKSLYACGFWKGLFNRGQCQFAGDAVPSGNAGK